MGLGRTARGRGAVTDDVGGRRERVFLAVETRKGPPAFPVACPPIKLRPWRAASAACAQDVAWHSLHPTKQLTADVLSCRVVLLAALQDCPSGTTALVALMLGGSLWLANVGDCRAVVCDDGEARWGWARQHSVRDTPSRTSFSSSWVGSGGTWAAAPRCATGGRPPVTERWRRRCTCRRRLLLRMVLAAAAYACSPDCFKSCKFTAAKQRGCACPDTRTRTDTLSSSG